METALESGMSGRRELRCTRGCADSWGFGTSGAAGVPMAGLDGVRGCSCRDPGGPSGVLGDVAGCPGDELLLADLAAGEALDHLGCFVVGRSLPVEVELTHADVGDALVAVGKADGCGRAVSRGSRLSSLLRDGARDRRSLQTAQPAPTRLARGSRCAGGGPRRCRGLPRPPASSPPRRARRMTCCYRDALVP